MTTSARSIIWIAAGLLVFAGAASAEVERIAREQYGFVRRGEVSYIVVPSEPLDDVIGSTPEAAPVAVVEADRSFLERIWDFVTGNDQSQDG